MRLHNFCYYCSMEEPEEEYYTEPSEPATSAKQTVDPNDLYYVKKMGELRGSGNLFNGLIGTDGPRTPPPLRGNFKIEGQIIDLENITKIKI